MKITQFTKIRDVLGESPLWDHRHLCWYWVDSERGILHRYDNDSLRCDEFDLGQKVGGIGLCNQSELVVSLQAGVYILELETGRLRLLADPEPDKPENRLNDSRVGPDGAYWVGSHCDAQRLPTACLYRVTPQGEINTIDENMTIVNGIAFSPSGDTLYYADTPARKVYQRSLDPDTGEVGPRKIFSDFKDVPGRPDGAAVDQSGKYWSALVRGGALGRFDTDGTLLETFELPVEYPTMCSFGGSRLDQLLVTSTGHLLSEKEREKQPDEGKVYLIDQCGAQGMRAHVFET